MNNDELHDKILSEIRISELNTHKAMQEMFLPYDDRIRALEHWRTFLAGVWAGIVAWIGFGGAKA